MSRIAISDTGDWKLKFEDDQDVRGFRALDKDGTPVGTVDAMIADTDAERIVSIVLEDGTEYPARDISIGDGVVYLTTVDAGDIDGEVRVYGDEGHVIRRERVEDGDYDAHVDAFRTHYTTAYGTSGGRFEDAEDAYRYGFETAHHDDYRNRGYADAEADLESGYGTRVAGRDFGADRAAVRYGYTRAQHATR